MYLRINYTEQEDGICICRCYGYGDVLVIPESVHGRPVTALGAYALSSSRPPKTPDGVKEAVLEEEEQGFGQEQELSGERLSEVILPCTLRRIGDYAFYLCRRLKRLHIRGNINKMGGGVFVQCRMLSFVAFEGISYENNGAAGVLSELTQELRTEFVYEDGVKVRLTFPEYYEESVENTPARIIEIHWHGSGYKYRQCFPGTRLDLKRYDGLFPHAAANEFASTCIRIALNRLQTPVELTEEAKEAYRAYLGDHMETLLREAVRRDDLETIRLLAGEDLLGQAETDLAARLAAQYRSAETGSYLMDYRRQRFRPGKKTFEL